jgi:hypothetical protein
MSQDGAQRLDYSEAEQMLRAGATQREVALRYGVTVAAVSAAIKRGRIKFDTGYQRILPWKMKANHANLAVPRMLRLAERIRTGRDDGMPDYLRAQGEGFARKLDEMDAVIHYDPDVSPYWFRVPRRPGVDTGLVREPEDSQL